MLLWSSLSIRLMPTRRDWVSTFSWLDCSQTATTSEPSRSMATPAGPLGVEKDCVASPVRGSSRSSLFPSREATKATWAPGTGTTALSGSKVTPE